MRKTSRDGPTEWSGKTSLRELKTKELVMKRVMGREFQPVQEKETAGPEAQKVNSVVCSRT